MDNPALTRHVKALLPELDDLFTAGEQVAALMEQPGWRVVCDVLDREAEALMVGLDRLREPVTQAEYAIAHGRRGGCLAVQEAAHSVVQLATERQLEQQAKHERDGESSQRG